MKTITPKERLPYNEWRAFISASLDKLKRVQTNRHNYTSTAKLGGANHSKNKMK